MSCPDTVEIGGKQLTGVKMHLDDDQIRIIGQIPDYADRLAAAAAMYTENGWRILPVKPNTKALPAGFNYNLATSDPHRAAKWWGEGGKFRGHGISLAAGPGSAVIVDLDIRDGLDGGAKWEQLVGFGVANYAPRQVTPSGGVHLLFDFFEGAESVGGKVAAGVDVRGGNMERGSTGHALVWPTVFRGVEYRWEATGALVQCPEEFREAVLKITSMSYQRSKIAGGRGQVDAIEEIEIVSAKQLKGLLKDVDPQDLTYDEWIKVGMALKTHLPDDTGRDIWEEWSQQDGDRYIPGECHKKWAGFDRRGAVTVATIRMYARAHLQGQTPQEYHSQRRGQETSYEEKLDDLVAEMNREFAILKHGGKVKILQHVGDRGHLHRSFELLSKDDFYTLMMNKRVSVPDGKRVIEKTYAEIWMASEKRAMYDGLTMEPGKPRQVQHGISTYYNMWVGWPIESAEGNWSRFRNHILEVVCNGDESLFEWVLDWMAFALQEPGKMPGTAIVMRGGEGTGKGTFAQVFGALFGRHYQQVTHSDHLVGKFNSMLEDAVLLFADEVTYGGDRRTAGVLKAMVTEPTMNIERKGLEAVRFRNNIHLIIATNEKWVVPAGPSARRWLCLDVSAKHMQSKEYFDALFKQMNEEGGLQAMQYDLQRREITHNLKVAPTTAMRDEQKAAYVRVDSVQLWWTMILGSGSLPFPVRDRVDPGTEDKWPVIGRFRPQVAYQHYSMWCANTRQQDLGEYRFYMDLYSFGIQKNKVQGVNYMRLSTLEEHRKILIHKAGFDPFAIHDTEETEE